MRTSTIESLENNVQRFCDMYGYTLKKHTGTTTYWTVIDDYGFQYLYNEEELAEYFAKLVNKSFNK
jgi:hypothetical protein